MLRAIVSLIVIGIACLGCEGKRDLSQSGTPDAAGPTGTVVPPSREVGPPGHARHDEGAAGKPLGLADSQGHDVSFPDTGIVLRQPVGFDVATNFEGFQQPNTQSSVMIVRIPGPFSEVTRGFTAEPMKAQGLTLVSKETIEICGTQGMLLHLTQTAYGTVFAKWLVAWGDEKATMMITATFPRDREGELSDQLKSVVLSARVGAAPTPAPGADIGFAITASEKLTATRGIGKMLAYTKDGVIPSASPEDPLFVVAPSVSQIPISDPRQFSIQRIHQTAQTKINSIRSTDEISIDGLDGFEIVADAVDANSGTPLIVYQVVLFQESSYVLIQGLVGARMQDDYLPEFKAMARSFTRQR